MKYVIKKFIGEAINTIIGNQNFQPKPTEPYNKYAGQHVIPSESQNAVPKGRQMDTIIDFVAGHKHHLMESAARTRLGVMATQHLGVTERSNAIAFIVNEAIHRQNVYGRGGCMLRYRLGACNLTG